MGLPRHQKNPKHDDITLKIKCEERKSFLGLVKSGGDADKPNAPDRLWKGPACQLTYWIDGTRGPWRQEIRTDFEDTLAASKVAGVQNVGNFALSQLKTALRKSDFPIVLASEWKQGDRLSRLLTSDKIDHASKLRIISLVRKVPEPRIFMALKKMIDTPILAQKLFVRWGIWESKQYQFF